MAAPRHERHRENRRWSRQTAFPWLVLLVAARLAAAERNVSFQPVTPAGRPGSGASAAGFTELRAASVGIAFTNTLSDEPLRRNVNLANGSGVAAGDFDSDGWCDLFFCAINGTNALFRNLGDWRFADVTAASGLTQPHPHCTGAVFADVNGDRAPDLLVSCLGGGVHAYWNDGHGGFREMTGPAGLTSQTGSTTMALGDADGDGDLDLYVANYGAMSYLRSSGRAQVKRVNGQWVFTGPMAHRLRLVNGRVQEIGEPDVLYLNDGKGHFTPLPWTDGHFLDEAGRPKPPPADYGLTVQMRDVNRDGRPDIYVCNDFQTPDRLWLNQGNLRFRLAPLLALRHESFSSMSVDFADLDHDGFLDFFVTEMWSRDHRDRQRQLTGSRPVFPRPGFFENRPDVVRNTLFRNQGDDTWAEIAHFAGVAASDWSWSQAFLDVDLDGHEDLLVINGVLHDVQDRDTLAAIRRLGRQPPEAARRNLLRYPPFLTPNVAWRHRGDLTFEDRSTAWGFAATNISTSLALADLDNDGDQDVVLNTLAGSPLLYRNEATGPRLAVELRGPPANPRGVGARIRLRGGPVPVQEQEILAGGRYLGGDQPRRTFAASPTAQRLVIEVDWPDGHRSRVADARPNRIYVVDHAGSLPAEANAAEPVPRAWFADWTDRLKHAHHEPVFNDYARQPLLTRQRSSWGPGLTWCDLDGDGWEDLLVGSGQGGRTGVRRNRRGEGFTAVAPPPFDQPAPRDQTTLLPLPDEGGVRAILAGSSNYEDGGLEGALALTWDVRSGQVRAEFPGRPPSTGPLALADYDGDGDLDLFVGGQVRPGRYPEPVDSWLYHREASGWRRDDVHSRLLRGVGLVNAGVWSDLEADGFPELILACEWGPIRIFRNRRGTLSPWDPALRPATRDAPSPPRLSGLTGWWTGLNAGDFNSDGRLDLVAANWGLNTGYRAAPQHPLRLDYGDVLETGTVDLIESQWIPELNAYAPIRSLAALSRAFPMLAATFPNHRAYAAADLDQVLAALPGRTRQVTATTLASVVLFNEGGTFRVARLPAQAQWSPAFGVCVADADGDGNEDVFLSQNFFALRPEWPRMDAGRGLWLQGDGRGGFRPASGVETGVKVYGEGRGAALADFDHDGRVDLAVGQNGSATRLYRNQTAAPGLRIRLNAGKKNPWGIGGVIRLEADGRLGPAREIHAGAGWWSVDAPTQIMAPANGTTAVEVRWPSGQVGRYPIPAGTRELTLNPPTASGE